MSEETTTTDAANEAAATNGKTKTTKAKPEVTLVKMNDGREGKFVGKRNLNKDYAINKEAGTVKATFDFRTGDALAFETGIDDVEMLLQAAGHGLIQKCGDECSKVKPDAQGNPDVESMVVAVESVITRLSNREASLEDRWYAETEGDGFSGASVVIKAIMEASSKDTDFVKAFLEKKLEAGKKDGLTRQKLYAAYRKPGTQIATIIARMEQEKLAANVSNVDADADLAEMKAAA